MAAPISATSRPRLFELPEGAAAFLNRAALPLICLLPVLLYFQFLTEPFEGDEGAYATIAQNLLHGSVPYRDLFDHKPPLIYVYYALSFLLFGENVVAPRILATLAWSGSAYLVFVETRLLFGRRRALIAATLLALSSGLMLLTANANTEVFMLLPMLGSLIAFTRWTQSEDRRWLLAAGALGGLAALTKQVGVWNLAGLAVYLIVWRLRSHQGRALGLDLAALAGSSLVVLAIVLAPFAAAGALGDFYYDTVVYNQMYSSNLALDERLAFTMYGLQSFLMVATPYIGGTLLALMSLRRERKTRGDWLVITSLIASILGVFSSGYYFRHYFVVLLPFMSMLCAMLIEREIASARPSRVFLITAAALVAVALVFNLPAYLASTPAERHTVKFLKKQAERETASRTVAAYIASMTTPDDRIYDYGRTTQIYFFADRRPAIRYIYDRSFFLDANTLTEALHELEQARPLYITDTEPWISREDFERFHPQSYLDFLAANYDYVDHIEFADIYRLKGAPEKGAY